MPRFDVVLFDLGNTLIYFDGEWPAVSQQGHAVLLEQLSAAGYDLDGESFTREFQSRIENYYQQRETEFIEYTTTYFLRTLLGEFGYTSVPDRPLQAAVDAMYAISEAYWKREDDALPTLQTLLRHGYRLGMVSNAGDDSDVQRLVDQAQLRPYFEVILTSAAQGIRKPNPRIFYNALEQWRVTPERAVMVGDTLGADILGAVNAGLYSIWISRRADTSANRAHLDTIQPDAVIERLDELPDLLASLSETKGPLD